jgi:hypothetical protein
MVTASKNNDYAAYEAAKQDAEKHKGVDAKEKRSFFRKPTPDGDPDQDIRMIDQVAASAFAYDQEQRNKPEEYDNVRVLDNGVTIYSFTETRADGLQYHNGDDEVTREEMVKKIDELYLQGKATQAMGLMSDLERVDSEKNGDRKAMFEKVFSSPGFTEKIKDLAEDTSDVRPFAPQPAFSMEGINFDAEILTNPDGVVKTFSTDGGEVAAKHRIPFSAAETQQVDDAMVSRLSANNEAYKQNVYDAIKRTSDQDTREGIAMHFIHAAEFDKAVDGYPDGPAKNVMKAEIAGMYQYASRFAKYEAGRKDTDDADLFLSSRIGDIHRWDNNENDRASQMTLEEKLVANGVSRQVEIAAAAYDDEHWGDYFTEARKYFN